MTVRASLDASRRALTTLSLREPVFFEGKRVHVKEGSSETAVLRFLLIDVPGQTC